MTYRCERHLFDKYLLTMTYFLPYNYHELKKNTLFSSLCHSKPNSIFLHIYLSPELMMLKWKILKIVIWFIYERRVVWETWMLNATMREVFDPVLGIFSRINWHHQNETDKISLNFSPEPEIISLYRFQWFSFTLQNVSK